jgi:phosphopantothenoylcysteine decarboxylase/phosphopantothenate--cysteine ligase
LIKTTDILAGLGAQKKSGQVLIGFALETENEREHAIQKLKNKNLDFIVLNSLKDEGAGFKGDQNKITIIDKNLTTETFDLKPKTEVAADICQKIINLVS